MEDDLDSLHNKPEFQGLEANLGIDELQQCLVKVLAEKVKKLLPAKKEEKENELRQIENQMRQLGLNSHQEDNFDALIIKLVQGAISKITINLVGHDVRVDSEELNTGYNLNRMLKRGVVEASKEARQTESFDDFHKRLVENIQKDHGIRDHIFNIRDKSAVSNIIKRK